MGLFISFQHTLFSCGAVFHRFAKSKALALVFLCIFRWLPSHKNLTQISLCYLGDLTRYNFNFFSL
jgi:hypothetical protein